MKTNKVITFVLIIAIVAAAAVFSVVPVGKYKSLLGSIILGLDLQGGVHVVYTAEGTDKAKVTDDAMKATINKLDRRVNALGVSEPVIQQLGKDRIIVELAGVKDPERVVKILGKTALLEFKTFDGKTVLTGADLANAEEVLDPSGEAMVSLTFNSEGAKKFADVTTSLVNNFPNSTDPKRQLAIYLDNELIQNPSVREPITGGTAQISGYKNIQEAAEVAINLKSGALPLSLKQEASSIVEATLGKDSLQSSKIAGLLGVLTIFVFMIGYYRLPGFVATIALLVYSILVLAIFVMFKFTLTLPGIAGFIISIGVAVDANVIIFERLKEELNAGKSLRPAIASSFKRAFVTIFDSNITTLITTGVLFWLGTGPIKGFALTLAIGIIVSMFTAITLTRWLMMLTAETQLVTNLRLYGAKGGK
jgi:preprotein translocase subunit SecD